MPCQALYTYSNLNRAPTTARTSPRAQRYQYVLLCVRHYVRSGNRCMCVVGLPNTQEIIAYAYVSPYAHTYAGLLKGTTNRLQCVIGCVYTRIPSMAHFHPPTPFCPHVTPNYTYSPLCFTREKPTPKKPPHLATPQSGVNWGIHPQTVRISSKQHQNGETKW